MTILYTTTEKTLAPGQALVFDAVRKTGCSEHITGTSPAQVYLKPDGLFAVTMSGNIGSPTAATAVQVQVENNGVPIPEMLAISVPAAVGDFNNVSRRTGVSTSANCCFDIGASSLSVVNTGANSVVIGAGFSLMVNREG